MANPLAEGALDELQAHRLQLRIVLDRAVVAPGDGDEPAAGRGQHLGQLAGVRDGHPLVGLESRAHGPMGVVEPGASRAGRYAERFRDLGRFQPQVVMHDENRPLLGWQPQHAGFVDGADRYYTAWKALAKA